MITEVAQYLEDEGIGTQATNIFISRLPSEPSACISVYDTGGLPPDRYLPTAEPTFQIIVRNPDYALGKAKVDAIVALLHQKKNLQLVDDGTYFYYIMLMGEPSHIGVDKQDRDEFSMNLVCKIRR